MKRKIISWLAVLVLFCMALPVYAAGAEAPAGTGSHAVKGKILFVPHDNRPISDAETADTVRRLGYEVVVPPDGLLGGRSDPGHPDELWQWVEANAPGADAVVFSSDAMVYGSLVASRKHSFSQEEVMQRSDRFAQFRREHPALRTYAFGSIMRTPRSAEAASAEPDYYAQYGSAIFRYTALTDKQETEGLTGKEQKEYETLARTIPAEALKDWMDRRQKNFAVSTHLIDMAQQGTFDYLVLGRDDNAPYSQTHMESRHLAQHGSAVGATNFQAMAGIDEIGMLLLARAVNDMNHTVPFIHVTYNKGMGAETIPSYSDEAISASIRSHTAAAGGMLVSSPDKADLVLFINTNPDGRTYEANTAVNTSKPRSSTKYFVDLVSQAVAHGYPVGIGDIAFANGADNALMRMLQERGLLFKIRAYAGWNTATNSTGFVLGQGMLMPYMSDGDCDALLAMRYLDDWAYQANLRGELATQLSWMRHGDGLYSTLGSQQAAVAVRATDLMRQFAHHHLPPLAGLDSLLVDFPWNRMFEAKISFS